MLAFDIETLGLMDEVPLPEITCVCMYDGTTEYKIQIWKVPDEAQRRQNIQQVISLLDDADTIAGFRAVYFDLEFIKRSFDIPDKQMTRWVRKCVDPYMHAQFITGTPCKLQKFLDMNGLESKTGNGGDAITLAHEGQWEKLLDYCLMDAKLTYNLCTLDWVFFTSFLLGKMRDSASVPPAFMFAEFMEVEEDNDASSEPNSNQDVVVVDGESIQN